MGRPREHDIDSLLERAVAIMVERGVHRLTLRDFAAATGASNGVIYHAFGSRSALVVMAYLREAERFLSLQLDAVEQARTRSSKDVAAPVVAAAQALSTLAQSSPTSASFLLLVRYDDLLDEDISDELRHRLSALTDRLATLFIDLAKLTWQRSDRLAVDTIRACVVDLPTGLLMHRDQLTDRHAIARVEAAARGIVAAVPPARTKGKS